MKLQSRSYISSKQYPQTVNVAYVSKYSQGELDGTESLNFNASGYGIEIDKYTHW